MRKLLFLIPILLLTTAWLTAQSDYKDFYDPSVVRDIRITFDQPNWKDMLDSMRLVGDGMLIGKAVIDGVAYDNVGIAYAESPTYQTAGRRNPWFIKLNFIDKNKNHKGIKTLTFSPALRDPSMVREVLAYEIARKYMPAPKANFINLTVNGENRGVHINIETIGEAFFEQHFGTTEGVAFRCVPDFRNDIKSGSCERTYGALKKQNDVRCLMTNIQMLSKEGWDDLINLTQILSDAPQNLYKILNIDRTLWYLAFNNVLVNLNSYAGPVSGYYYLYKDKDGLFNIIPTEMNLAFGSLKNISEGASDLDLSGLATLDPYIHQNNLNRPLIAQLLKNPDLKKVYMAHIRQILSDWFENDTYKQRALALQATIASFYANDKGAPYSLSDMQRNVTETIGSVTKIPGISELMFSRAKYLRKHPDLLNLPPQVAEITVSNRKKFSNATVTEFRIKAKVDRFPRRVVLFYRPAGSNEPFKDVQMLDDGKSHDVEAGDKIFGAVVNPNGKYKALEYYILAENAGATAFDPPNYVNVKHKITLDELNK